MDTLKRYLAENDIEYLEKVFATSESIGGLLPNPFVSQKFDTGVVMLRINPWGIFEVRSMYVLYACMHVCVC